MTLLTLTAILFLIMDPVGRLKAFLQHLGGIPQQRQRSIIIREFVIALAVILFFNFVGEYIFNFLDISDVTVYLASGIILFLVSIKILFPRSDDSEMQKPAGEPLLVPLAIPMIASPALLATVMLFAQTETSVVSMITAILIAWALSVAILLSSKQLIWLLGSSGVTACEKLMGMVLVLLSVQRFMEGVLLFYKNTNG